MKKLFITCGLVLALSAVHVAQALSKHQGGYQNAAMPIMNISEVMVLQDDAPVKVAGKITKQVKGDKYQLEDASGTIIVEIESEAWGGNTITETDEVIILGEVDKDHNATEIDAHAVMKK
jgi:uncharacterized protein (TIGR00156 family)